ncbi:MAG: metallophosphoesterase [Verrucomicrobiota bacterium]
MAPANPVGRDLTAGSALEFRAIRDEAPQPWCRTLADAVNGLVPQRENLAWPSEWQAFSTGERSGHGVDLSLITTEIPASLSINGRTLAPIRVRADDNGIINLTAAFGGERSRRHAILFARVHVPVPATVHAGADWQMRWWVNGNPVFDTMSHGNRRPVLESAHEFFIGPGTWLLAVEVVSGNGGWSFASEATTQPANACSIPFRIECRRRFRAENPSTFAGLTAVASENSRALLNLKPIPLPVEGMRFREINGLSTNLLQAGENELSRSWDEEESRLGTRALNLKVFRHSGQGRLEMPDRIFALAPEDLRITTGPVVCDISDSSAAITCRTNLPTPLELQVAGQKFASPPGLFHRFEVTELHPASSFPFLLIDRARRIGEGVVKTLSSSGDFSFAIVGDPSPVPRVWEKVAADIAKRDVDFVVFLGDATSNGLDDWRWDAEFFRPAARLFEKFPVLAISGNHDHDSPVFRRFFGDADGSINWAKRIGPTMLLGIDGAADWSEGSPDRMWLEAVLAHRPPGHLFVFDHYPPYSSTPHGIEDAAGFPVEPPMRTSRETLLPLFTRHRMTAMISGHAHCYERSHLPGDVTLITSGGAGGFLYDKDLKSEQNPFSQVFISRHHFSLVTVSAHGVQIEAIDTDGQILDRCNFPL